MPILPLGMIESNIGATDAMGGAVSSDSASGFGALVDSVLGEAETPSHPLIADKDAVYVVRESDGTAAGEDGAAIAALVTAMSFQNPLQLKQSTAGDPTDSLADAAEPAIKGAVPATSPQPVGVPDVLQVETEVMVPTAEQGKPSDRAVVIDASTGGRQAQVAASAAPIADGGSDQERPDGAVAKAGAPVEAVAAAHPRALFQHAQARVDRPYQSAPLPPGSVAAYGDGRDAPKLGRENLETLQAGSAKLGKPLLAMATHEVLQADAGAPDGAVVLHANDFGASPLIDTRGGAPAAMPASMAPAGHSVTLATRPENLVRDFGDELVRGVKRGEQELAIRLDPPELGRIDVRMRFGEDGRMRAVIAADNPHTFDLMRRDVDTLTRALADAGIKADPQDLRFDLRQGSSHDQRQRSQMDGGWNRSGEEGPEIETQSARESTVRGLMV